MASDQPKENPIMSSAEIFKLLAPNYSNGEMPVSELRPGMKAVEEVYSREGALGVRSGTVIDERIIRNLDALDIQFLKVDNQEETYAKTIRELTSGLP